MTEKQVYLGLMQVLTEQQGNNPAALVHFDWYNQQDQDIINKGEEDEQPDTFAMPAAFMHFTDDIEWYYIGANLKEVEIMFELVVIQEQPQDVHSHENTNIRDAGLEWMDELQRIILLCESSSGDQYHRIRHLSTRHDHDHYEFRVTQLRFEVTLRDTSRQKTYTKVRPKLKVEPEIKNPPE